MSVLADYTKTFLQRARDSMLYSTNLGQPAVNDDDDDDDDDAPSMFFSIPGMSTHHVQETIPLTDSLAFRDGGIRRGGNGGLNNVDEGDYDEYEDDARQQPGGYNAGNLGYSDYSYSSKVSELPSDLEELPTPSAIYLDVPPPVPSSSSYPNKNSLSESLLPSAAIPSGVTTVRANRKYQDPFFAILYGFCMVVFFIAGIVLLAKTDSRILPRDSHLTIFYALRDSSGMLVFMIVFSMLVGMAWILVLRHFARYIVWGTVIAVPFFTIGMSIWTLVESFQGNRSSVGGRDPQDTGLTALSIVPLLIGILYLRETYQRRDRVGKTITVIELACEILKNNPEMFVVSFGIMMVFLTFTVIWLVFFSRLWLVGHPVTRGTSGVVGWVVEENIWPLVVFFVLMYLWTAAILRNIQRFVLAGVTAQWYFQRHEPVGPHTENPTRAALSRATKTSFGTLCFGGLILSTIQLLHLGVRYAKKNVKGNNPNMFLEFLGMCFQCLDGIIDQVNNYTIIYSGITGESFWSSARSATKIFRRNLVTGLLSDLITKLILYIGSVMVALTSGFGTFIFATHSLNSPYGYIVGIVATIVPLYVSQFYTYIMANIIDATFMCYAIDLDHNKIHSQRVHDAFAGPGFSQ